MIRKKIRKYTGSLEKATGFKEIACRECSQVYLEVTKDIRSVVCAFCVQKMAAPPPKPVAKAPEGEQKPRGWHKMTEYVDFSGKVYERGVDTGRTVIPPKKKEPKVKDKKSNKEKDA
jgi:hypothetical protein